MRKFVIVAGLLLSGGMASAEEFGVLHVAPGVEEVWYACTACHSEHIVAQQGLTRDGWDGVLTWMNEEMGMAELPGDLEATILDYLAANYGPDRPHFTR
ncbi:MAG: aldehyde dehydrogenase [Pseudomonadota bacterium]